MTAKARKPTKAREPRRPGRRRGQRLAVTSGEAARYCLVSSDTIANWIASGRLAAQRTAGGQYRIRVADLRSFMTGHKMCTELLDQELGCAPSCWRFWTARGQSEPSATCLECPVYRAQAWVCHEIRPMLPGGTQRAPSCAECAFVAALGESNDERSR